jgi:hypothetical protein
MTRDQLEAAIWRRASLLNSTDPQDRIDAMTDVLKAADAYAVTQGGITAERRGQLEASLSVAARRALAAAVHCLDGDGPACRMRGQTISTTALADVTCRHCKRTRAYLDAPQAAGATMATATTGGTP